MAHDVIRLDDGEILSRLLTRRRVARISAGVMAAVPAFLGGFGRQVALAQTPTADRADDEATIDRPATPAGSLPAESIGPVEPEVGPPPGRASSVPGISMTAFMDLSLALVGGGRLDEDRGGQLLDLIATDPARLTALHELLAIRAGADAATPIATPVAALTVGSRELAEQILRFWYLGTFDGQPVNDRAGFWFSLSAWQAVKYTYATSVCRAFGIWAGPPPGA